jgi:hypothetical protein
MGYRLYWDLSRTTSSTRAAEMVRSWLEKPYTSAVSQSTLIMRGTPPLALAILAQASRVNRGL